MEPQAHGGGRQLSTALGEENPPLRGGHVPAPGLQRAQRRCRSGCRGMVRPPVVPLLARFGTWSTSATCPVASVTMAHVSDAISFARKPAFIDNRNMTQSRDEERVVARYPSIARSWVGLTLLACFACRVTTPSARSHYSYVNID